MWYESAHLSGMPIKKIPIVLQFTKHITRPKILKKNFDVYFAPNPSTINQQQQQQQENQQCKLNIVHEKCYKS